MFQRLVFTIATAFTLTGMYLVYSAVMRPIVVIPAPVERPEERNDTRVDRPYENARVASKYISPERWAIATAPKQLVKVENCDLRAEASKYMLRAEEGFIYTNSWEQNKEYSNRIHFKPFAVVWLTKDQQGQEQAYSIVTKRATVEFASKFDEKNQNPGRIVGAVLEGTVDITGPDGLHVKGSDFHFEEEGLILYSHDPVSFQYQSHQGSGTRIDMKLIPADGPPGKDRPHIFGVESIHLSGRSNQDDPKKNQYVKMLMQLPQGNETRPIRVNCAELTYTVATNTAVLTKGVRAQTVTEPYDILECDKLTLQFAPKQDSLSENQQDSAKKTPDDDSHKPDFQKVETNLEFSCLEAIGVKDAPVRIISRSNGVEATMARLTYSEESRTIFMSSEDSPDDVEVTRNSSILKVPQINVELDEQKKNIETLVCLGKGELRYFDEVTGRLNYVAAWQNHLRKFMDAETKLDLIELDGTAQFRQPKPDPKDRSGILAERIKIWLQPMNLGLPSGENQADKSAFDPKPQRILAEREVALLSPQLQIRRTDELDIRFQDEDVAQTTSATRRPRNSQNESLITRDQSQNSEEQKKRLRLQPSSLTVKDADGRLSAQPHSPKSNSGANGRTPQRQIGFASVQAEPLGSLGPPVDIPFNDPVSNPPANSKDRLRASGRTVVSADKIGVLVRRVAGTQEIQPREVRAEGKVKITQERKPDEKPLTLEGQRVDMAMESQKQMIAHVQGSPAIIRDQKFEIEGKNLHLDRGINRAWVEGAGLLKLPLPADSNIPGLDAAPSRDLIVRWDESMSFNGLQAEFLGYVEAKLGSAKMTCGRMAVQLVHPISFQDESISEEPTLRLIRCRERVKFENLTHKERKVTEIYRGRVGEFTLNYAAGTVEAQGPGEVYAWQNHDKNGGMGQRDVIQANRPITTEVTVWDYTRLQFEGQLKGKIDGQPSGPQTRQKFDVYDRVEIIYGPVKSPTEQIDPDNLPSMAGTMRCGKLEFVNYPVSEKNPTSYKTFVGRENAEVEGQVDGRRFTASSDTISYDESKGLYVLRADGRQNARVTGIKTGNVIGRSIEFNPDPKLRILRVERAVEGQGSP